MKLYLFGRCDFWIKRKKRVYKILLVNELIHVQTLTFAWFLSLWISSNHFLRSSGIVGLMEESKAAVCLSNPSRYSPVEYSELPSFLPFHLKYFAPKLWIWCKCIFHEDEDFPCNFYSAHQWQSSKHPQLQTPVVPEGPDMDGDDGWTAESAGSHDWSRKVWLYRGGGSGDELLCCCCTHYCSSSGANRCKIKTGS